MVIPASALAEEPHDCDRETDDFQERPTLAVVAVPAGIYILAMA
jgi:hypothetical protein